MLEELRKIGEDFDQPFTYEIRVPATLPGAGAEFQIQVPGNEIWCVHYVRAVLTTSAAVANRSPSITIGDGNRVAGKFGAGAVVAAATVQDITWGWNLSTVTGANALVSNADLGDLPILDGQWQINSVTGAKDAADQYSAITVTAFIYRQPPTGVAKRLTDRNERWRQAGEALRAAAALLEADEPTT